MINFPLYAIRKYQEIFEDENGYTIIQTAKNRYVLDTYLEGVTYAERRLLLLADEDKPHKLYPLNARLESINQIHLTTCRKFIDSTGKLLTWKPSKMYPVVCLPVKSSWHTAQGKVVLEIKDIPTKFTVSGNAPKYVQVMQVGRKNILFDVCDEYRKRTRKKL